MKLVQKQLLFAALALAVFANAENLIKGQRYSHEVAICQHYFDSPAKTNKRSFTFVNCAAKKPYQVITAIEAREPGNATLGGNAKIVKGGLGRISVTLKLISEYGKQLSYNVSVHAVPKRLLE